MSIKSIIASALILLLSGCATIDEFLFDAYPDGTPVAQGDGGYAPEPAPAEQVDASASGTDGVDAVDAQVARMEADEAALEQQRREQAKLVRVQQAAQRAEEARLKAEQAARKARGELWYRIGFASGRTAVDSETARVLNKIAAKLKNEPAGKSLAIRGYCDAEPIGGYDGNRRSAHNFDTQKALSQARADAVRNKLIEAGIPRDLITSEGFGASEFIADNDTVEGRDKNRRVDVFLVER